MSAELQRAEHRFSSVHGEEGVWSAPNRAHDIRSRVSADGIEVVPRSAGAADAGARWTLALTTKTFGRMGQTAELDPTTVRATNERIELDHGAITEWFVNDERGLEQGWTIASAPSGAEPLWIGLEISGDLNLRIDTGGRSSIFVDATGEPRLRYTGLMAFDATGRELAARLAPSPHGVGITIDDVGAVYPLTVDPLLTGPAWTAEGDQAGAWFGSCVASAGDVNGDGYSDVIVGAPLYDNGELGEGRAFVYLGAASGLSTSAAWTAESDQPSAEFGNCVATAGDVNGDGFSDVIITAWLYDHGETDEGRAFVYLGSSAGLATSAAWTTESDQQGAELGISAATAGDVNGDGYSDVIVGASLYDGGQLNEGRALVYLGSSSGLGPSAAWTAESNQVDARFGVSVAAAGDVNGDGYGEVLVGANQYDNGEMDEGRAYLYPGSGSGLGTNAAWTTESNQAGAHFGFAIATAGDVNGDGYSDVIVGSSFYGNGETSEGRAFVYLGTGFGLSASAAWTAEGDQDFAFFGSAVGAAGDVNGDGYSDVIIGSYGYDNGEPSEGRALIYLGAGAGLSTVAAWTAESNQGFARLGSSVAAAGDVNGDGYSDVIVGARTYDDGQMSEGRAFVYMGAAGGISTSANWTGTTGTLQGGGLGTSVSTAGDVNGDGYSDVVVGAPSYGNGQKFEGVAFVYLGSNAGSSTSAASMPESNQGSSSFGWSVSTAGDVDGDGYSDVIVGAYRYDNGQTDQGRAFLYRGSAAGLSTQAAWTAESDAGASLFGWSVATAGDVNGDGYGDVIVGAPTYDHPQDADSVSEGAAFLYSGSRDGLSAEPAWIAYGPVNFLPNASQFGASVATAGDVNGDGFSDVVVGAPSFDNDVMDEGGAFVYLGSPTGLSNAAAVTLESHEHFSSFGNSVASAGDVNGDGFSDVLVGSRLASNGEFQEGRAYLYLGSSTGLSTSAAWTAESDQVEALFGQSVASAGDVNGDGYSDVIVGAHYYADRAGRAYLYFGSGSGLSAAAAWTAQGVQGGQFGISVATAGDVNGDGYSDVIVGAHQQTGPGIVPGKAYIFLGNGGRGWTFAPQQRHSNDAAPIALLGRSDDNLEFRIHLATVRDFTGFSWASGVAPAARLEWEVRPLREPLDGTRIESGVDVEAITGSLVRFNELASIPSGDLPLIFGIAHHAAAGSLPYHWRARLRTNNPLFPVTPWTTIPWNNVTETKLRAGPLPAARVPR